jgi:hypothetical protein
LIQQLGEDAESDRLSELESEIHLEAIESISIVGDNK